MAFAAAVRAGRHRHRPALRPQLRRPEPGAPAAVAVRGDPRNAPPVKQPRLRARRRARVGRIPGGSNTTRGHHQHRAAAVVHSVPHQKPLGLKPLRVSSHPSFAYPDRLRHRLYARHPDSRQPLQDQISISHPQTRPSLIASTSHSTVPAPPLTSSSPGQAPRLPALVKGRESRRADPGFPHGNGAGRARKCPRRGHFADTLRTLRGHQSFLPQMTQNAGSCPRQFEVSDTRGFADKVERRSCTPFPGRNRLPRMLFLMPRVAPQSTAIRLTAS